MHKNKKVRIYLFVSEHLNINLQQSGNKLYRFLYITFKILFSKFYFTHAVYLKFDLY